MATSDSFRSASGLHMILRMKLGVVTMLAVLGASACGVGVDEGYDGQTVAASGQALEQNVLGAEPGTVAPAVPQTPATAGPSLIRDPGQVALPQDPIPVYEGKPVPPSGALGDGQPVPPPPRR